MIPFFFRRYRKAPLATCVSFMATICFMGTVLFTVGYFMNWEGLRDSGTTMGQSLLAAAACTAVGICFWKLAAWLAERKYQKLAAKGALPGKDAPAERIETTRPDPALKERVCPRCGAKPEPGDVYCIHCGAKL